MNTTPTQADKVAFRIKEVPAAYGICKTKLYELIADKKLRSVKVGGRRLILRADLDALVTGEAA